MKTIQNTPIQNLVAFRSKTVNQQPKVELKSIDRVTLSRPADVNALAFERTMNLTKNALFGHSIDKSLFENMTRADWVRTYNMSMQNGIPGYLKDAFDKNKDLKVPEEVRECVDDIAGFIENNHRKQEKVLSSLSSLTSRHGIDTMQMKGIGLSMEYPVPQHRYGSDIDVYNLKRGVDMSAPQPETSFMVDELAQKAGLELDTTHGVKHSVLTYKNVSIENHRNFLNVESSDFAGKMNDYLLKNINPREQVLPSGRKILVPSPEFNTVFLSFHNMQHYLSGDTNAHQLADWAVHVNNHGLKVPEEVKGTPLEKFMYALTNLSNRYFGTEIDVPENKKLEDSIAQQYLHCLKKEKPQTSNPVKIFMYKFGNMAKREQRRKDLLGEGSIVRGIVTSIKAHEGGLLEVLRGCSKLG